MSISIDVIVPTLIAVLLVIGVIGGVIHDMRMSDEYSRKLMDGIDRYISTQATRELTDQGARIIDG